jgi:nitric oxide synthase oxygenase domain/subunit
MAHKHQKTEIDKRKQHERTRANKIRHIEKALEVATGKGQELLKQRLEYWKDLK